MMKNMMKQMAALAMAAAVTAGSAVPASAGTADWTVRHYTKTDGSVSDHYFIEGDFEGTGSFADGSSGPVELNVYFDDGGFEFSIPAGDTYINNDTDDVMYEPVYMRFGCGLEGYAVAAMDAGSSVFYFPDTVEMNSETYENSIGGMSISDLAALEFRTMGAVEMSMTLNKTYDLEYLCEAYDDTFRTLYDEGEENGWHRTVDTGISSAGSSSDGSF